MAAKKTAREMTVAFLTEHAAQCEKMAAMKGVPARIRTALLAAAEACRNADGSLDVARELLRASKVAAIEARDPAANDIGVQQVDLLTSAKRAGLY